MTYHKTKITIGGKPVTIDRNGLFSTESLPGQSTRTLDQLRIEYEATLTAKHEAKAKAAARRSGGGIQVSVIDRTGKVQAALYRGIHGVTNKYLLTVNGEKTDSNDYPTVLRILGDEQVAEYNALRDASVAAKAAAAEAYAKGTVVQRWIAESHGFDSDNGAWKVIVKPHMGYTRKAQQDAPVLFDVPVTFDGEAFVAQVGENEVVKAPSLHEVERAVLRALHPHHDAILVRTDGTVEVYDAYSSTSHMVLGEGFDMVGYVTLAEAVKTTQAALSEWIKAHRFDPTNETA